MKRFITLTLIALLPVLAVIALYVAIDPFGVVYKYRTSYKPGIKISLGVNSGYNATECYKLYRDSLLFNSFIFGSSMSQNFKAAYWKEHLDKSASVFHYDASMETIEGINNKIKYINGCGDTVKHALIIIEEEMLHRKPVTDNFLYIQHPDVASDVTWFQFHTLFFNVFKNPTFIRYALSPNNPDNISKMLEKRYATMDIPDRIETINESYYGKFDSIIAVDPDLYFTPQRLKRNSYTTLPWPNNRTSDYQYEQLKKLAELLVQNHSDYCIILVPRYLREPFSKYDVYVLKQMFGHDKVHDFSDFEPMSKNPKCYYDAASHLISACCKQLLDSAYSSLDYNSIFSILN